MGNNDFAPYTTNPVRGQFVVQNIIKNSNKTIKIFNYPIPVGKSRDLLAIPGVSESDIRASLLKGEVLHKLLAQEIIVVQSDIDLLQFNSTQKSFLMASGITLGLSISGNVMTYLWNQDIQLLGFVNDINTNFTIPAGKFIQQGQNKIVVYRNGVKQSYLDDYTISESGGVGTGYDTVIFNSAPITIPSPADVITADYYTAN